MKAFLVAAGLFAASLVNAQAQQQADDNYIGIYGLIQRADHLAETGDAGEALAAYTDAQKSLQQFQRSYPDWNPNIVNFRLNQISEKIVGLKKQVPAHAVAAPANKTPAQSDAALAAASLPAAGELDNLRARLQSAMAANELLQAKLKEALSVQPAAVDPRELARAQEKIRWLMKENDLLKVSQAGGGAAGAVTRYVTNVVSVIVTNSRPVEVTNLAAVFADNNRPVMVTNYVRVLVADTNAIAMARLDRAAAVKNFNEEHARAELLAAELEHLRQNAGNAGTNQADLVALRTENAALKGELAALRAGGNDSADAGNAGVELKRAREQIARLQSAAEIAALEKRTLERKLQHLLSSTNASVSAVAYEARIRDLTQERDDLTGRLDRESRQKAGGTDALLTGQLDALNSEVATLRSRLSVAEAQPVPFTPEELALLRAGSPNPANSDAASKPTPEMSAATAALAASAQSHFARQEFDQAEADYQKILERDQNNGLALANLAMIELQQDKLTEAAKHIAAALAQSPNDPYNLSTLGMLKFRQKKYEESLNALSRAAQLDPNNPEIQNYLGLTLSQMGQRRQAETALRRAIQINPNYAPAQNNLAVVYLSQTPPMPELARWHYQKALAAGQPRNPDLEKLLAEKGAPMNP